MVNEVGGSYDQMQNDNKLVIRFGVRFIPFSDMNIENCLLSFLAKQLFRQKSLKNRFQSIILLVFLLLHLYFLGEAENGDDCVCSPYVPRLCAQYGLKTSTINSESETILNHRLEI